MTELDITGTVREAYEGAWSHLGEMVKLVWAPVSVYIVVNVLYAAYVQEKTAGMAPEDIPTMMVEGAGWPMLAMFLIGFFIWPIIAVAWHRFVLLGEKSSSAIYFKFGQREARFLFTSIALSLLPVPGLLVMIIGASTSLSTLALPIGLILTAVGLVYALRLSLLLPAIATDANVDVQAVLEGTKGNVLRIVATHLLNLLCVLLLAVAFGLVGTVVVLLVGDVGMAVTNTLLNVFVQVISVAILSIMYRDLIAGQIIAPPQVENRLH